VESLWWGSWDLHGQPDHVTELLGDPSVHVVCERGSDGVEARVVGVWSELWTRRLTGRGEVRAAKLRPGAAAALLPVDAVEVTDRRVALGRMFTGGDRLAATVFAGARGDGLGQLAAWLRERARPETETDEMVSLVAHVRAAGVLRVEDLACQAGRSVRWLQRRFRRHVGLSPKQVIRRFRLQEVARRVEAGAVPQLADLAYDLGYADQAHLARDFRAVTGRTLTGFEAGLDAPPGA